MATLRVRQRRTHIRGFLFLKYWVDSDYDRRPHCEKVIIKRSSVLSPSVAFKFKCLGETHANAQMHKNTA